MAVALPNGNTDGFSGKTVAGTLGASFPTFVLALLTTASSHIQPFGDLNASVQYFLLSLAATLVVGLVTFVASYFKKHADPTLVKAVTDAEHVIWDQAAYDAAKNYVPSDNPAKLPPTA